MPQTSNIAQLLQQRDLFGNEDPTSGWDQWNPSTYGGGRRPSTGLGNQPFFIPNAGYDMSGRPLTSQPMGGTTTSGPGTAGWATGQDPRYFQGYSSQAQLAEERRKAALAMMSQYGLDKPQTFIQPLLKEAATQNVQTMKDWENMSRDIESRYAGGGASLSSERNRSLEEGRGATMMAIRGARTKAETAGTGQWANIMAQLLGVMGR